MDVSSPKTINPKQKMFSEIYITIGRRQLYLNVVEEALKNKAVAYQIKNI